MADNTNPEFMTKPEFLNYNTMGYRPVKTTFNLDCEQMCKAIEEIASREIDGIVEVTKEHDSRTGTVGWFIWFDSNSDHFVDKQTNQTMIGQSIRRYSDKFYKFAMKYGWKESDDDVENGSKKVNIKNVVQNNVNPEVHRKLTFLRVSINPFLKIMFDSQGVAYQKQYGVEPPKVTVVREYKWNEGSKGKYHTLVGITVEKYITNAYRDYHKPRANRAANFV